jgi:hypothetical protein
MYHEMKDDSLSDEKSQLYGLTRLETNGANCVLAALHRTRNTGFELLDHAVYWYTHDDFSEDEVLIMATKELEELEELAQEDVLLVPEGHVQEYGKAQRRFADLLEKEHRVCVFSSPMSSNY